MESETTAMSDDLEVLPAIDRENLFLLFSAFSCDITRTAHAANLRPIDVLRVADECGWLERLKPILDLKKSSAPGDLERSVNRALSFTQAHRLRMLIDKAITVITNLTEEEFKDQLLVPNKNGFKTLTTRALTDLAASAEKASAQAAQALQDTAQDRARRDEASDKGEASGSIHSSIAAAMAAISKDCSPRAQLLDAQLIQAQEIVKTIPTKPENPADNDDH